MGGEELWVGGEGLRVGGEELRVGEAGNLVSKHSYPW